MKKKIIRAAAAILVLTVALSFAFSGCSNKKDGGDDTESRPKSGVAKNERTNPHRRA